jgi:arginyl-tRNA synthetase
MEAYLEQQLRTVLAVMGTLPADFVVEFETPANPAHGDLSTNAALKLARVFGKAPRQIADELAARLRALPLDPARVHSVEVAGPGFLNFRFADTFLTDYLAIIVAAGDTYGRTDMGAGRAALVEYVSANPTGPLTVGHGRNAVLGDTIANLLEWTGYKVTREYYFNDAGRQMRVLGESVRARYRELYLPDGPTKPYPVAEGEVVEVPEFFPDGGYVGDYITDIARQLQAEHGAGLLGVEPVTIFKDAAEKAIFADIERTMARLHIRMDTYFNENDLYENRAVWKVVDDLRARGYVFDQDGAIWFRTSALGKVVTDQQGSRAVDTVLVKSSGEPTYRLPDIAYHMDKLGRGFDRIVDIFGADHIATYPDVLRGVEALGGDVTKIDVLIYQFVTLVRGGEKVKMSTRRATYITLDELMDEVGEDVTRYFFLMLSPHTHLNFDLDLAREASEKNPVFYLQYAHARICSILRKAGEAGLVLDQTPDLSVLTHPSETGLMKTLLDLPAAVAQAADTKEPHRVAVYLREVAEAFSLFYRDCRILGEAPALGAARMVLADATRIVLRNGLTVLGISAPDKM